MWVPRSAAEVIDALPGAIETATLEFKSVLPVPGRNTDIAVDVSAMSTDGGTIVYGVDEDKRTSTFSASPIPLAGVVERITSVVRSRIGGWVDFEALTLKVESDYEDGRGFLVVTVPPSPLAPHMVQVEQQMCFYGRGPGGNIRLNQGEVDRMYERRTRWEEQRERFLDDAISGAPFRAGDGNGVVHLVVRPTLSDPGLRLRVWPSDSGPDLSAAIAAAHGAIGFARPWSPMLRTLRQGDFIRTLGGIALTIESPTNGQRPQYIGVRDDGGVVFHCGGLTDTYEGRSGVGSDQQAIERKVRDTAIAQLVTHVLSLTGQLLAQDGYHGPVDLGVLVEGVEGAVSDSTDNTQLMLPRADLPTTLRGDFHQTDRVLVGALASEQVRETARRLVGPLLRVVRSANSPDPLAPPTSRDLDC